MKRHYPIIAAAVLGLVPWIGPATAEPVDADDRAPAPASIAGQPAAPWILIEARNHLTGRSGLAAVLFGGAQERGQSRPAMLLVHCVDGRTVMRVDAVGLRLGSSPVAVRQSVDDGPFVAGAWHASADGGGLVLSGEPAVAFLTELHGRAVLRLAVVRPLSVPFVLTFAVTGAEPALRPLADRCHWSSGPAISDAGR